ncbi:MAG: sensor histidine kinase [Hyphomicrobiaceae bacterium]
MPRLRFKRLSTQIYATILATLLAVVVISTIVWSRASQTLPMRQALEVAGELVVGALPPPNAQKSVVAGTLKRISQRLDLDLAVFDKSHRLVANSGRAALPEPPRDKNGSGVVFGPGGPAWALALPDGRWLVARNPRRRARHPGLWFLGLLSAIAAVVGLTAWPVVRGLTRRLERLQEGVERLGVGDLSARVEVKGRDEVARLATSFNRSAARIEELVSANRLLLANASHELRTPLARVRMGVELLKDNADPVRKADLERDIQDLDHLIDEILLLSRLDANKGLDRKEPIDLLAAAAEEASRFDDIDVRGQPVEINGDPHLVRRLIRNLIENAGRHGRPPVSVNVGRREGLALLQVEDCGQGFSPADAERAFEPFHRGNTRGRTQGSGVGLALVRQIADRHGGSVRIVPGADKQNLNRIEVVLAVS